METGFSDGDWICRWQHRRPTGRRRLAARLFDLGPALANLEFRIALANHVDSATSLDDLAVGVPVLQGTNAADNFHRIDLNVCFVYL